MTRNRRILLSLALLVATVVAYLPTLSAGFIWNDDTYLSENPVLDSPQALRLIWTEPRVSEQYYPLVFSTFWAEKKLWGMNPLGYHLVNVLLHAAAAWLLWNLLRRLGLPGAFAAAAVFALHPVCVESVAWVTERKNTLSMVLVLLAANALLLREATIAAREPRRKGRQAVSSPSWYLGPGTLWTAALVCFTLALFAKTTAALLPAVILVLVWWRSGRIRWDDVRPLLPFFAIGAALAWNTAHLERTMVGASGVEWSLGLAGRLVLAGRVLAFYVGKLLWPTGLLFIYPRWSVDPAVLWQWLPTLAALTAVIAAFVLRARLGRGPLASLLLLGGVTFPAMGFFNVYAMRYSYVADHFAYQAAAVLCAAVLCGAAGLVAARPQLHRAGVALATAVAITLGGLTFAQTTVYKDEDTLWRHTLAGNGECFMCHTNYGYSLYARGRMAEAVEHFQTSLRLRPDNPEPLLNLARVEEDRGQLDAAIDYASRALSLAPRNTTALVNLGALCVKAGRVDEAIGHFRSALAIGSANDYLAHNGLGAAAMQQGRVADAVEEFRAAVAANPAYWKASANLERALQRLRSPAAPAR